MVWSSLAAQFCLELSFGLLVALAFVPKAPVGSLFYRVMGSTALLPILLAAAALWRADAVPWRAPILVACGIAAAAYPLYSGPFRGRRWASAIALAIAACATAVVLLVAADDAGRQGILSLTLGGSSALATGAVAGSVGLSMVLGHWYLTVPNLSIEHLRRLNHVAIASMTASMVLVLLSCLVFRAHLDEPERRLFGSTGLFYLGTRLAVGLGLPLLFAWMAESALSFKNTRSATGILYASTVLVLIGTAVSVALQDTYGVPL